jgi:preprotein translocase subunit SecF
MSARPEETDDVTSSRVTDDEPTATADEVTDADEPTATADEATDADEPTAPADGSTTGAGVTVGAGPAGADRAAVKRTVWSRLYHGETNVDFVGRRRIWFTLSLVAVLVSLVSFGVRGLNLGIDFEGGVVWQVPAGDASVADARDTLDDFGLAAATIQSLDSDEGTELRVQSEPLAAEQSDEVTATLAEITGSTFDDVTLTEVGPSWGEEISEKALRALVVFMVLVSIYIWLRFELKMAAGTLMALIHDVIVTVGVYSVTQLEVTPATVIAVLTILGYSIYDGIVVFDKVDENTRLVSSTGGLSYGGMINVSLNQALMRSLNTTITALLPVGALLVVGSWIMGAAVLEEFAVALLIGLFSGAYSSIFIASPVLAWLKEREPRYRDIKRRIDARGGDSVAVATTVATGRPPSARVVAATAAAGEKKGASAPVSPSGRAIPPRPRKKTKGHRR